MNGFDQLNWFQPCYYNLFSHAMAYEALISERIVALRRKKRNRQRPSCLQTVNNLLTLFVRTSGKLDDT